ncbi:MAG: hypothetical protein IJS47_02185 [Clostridia bacterium]|nr:hypothetical protein [Clostridia bacterium]
MSLTLNLVAEQENVLKNFLTKYFEKDMMVDNITYEWSYTLENPLTATEIISAVMDNNLNNLITTWVSFDPNIFIKVKENNYNDVIKYILERYS